MRCHRMSCTQKHTHTHSTTHPYTEKTHKHRKELHIRTPANKPSAPLMVHGDTGFSFVICHRSIFSDINLTTASYPASDASMSACCRAACAFKAANRASISLARESSDNTPVGKNTRTLNGSGHKENVQSTARWIE
jgi:hypothetical protein